MHCDRHPETADIYHNMATIFQLQDRPEEALEDHGKALAIDRDVLGNRNANSALNYHNMAHVLQ